MNRKLLKCLLISILGVSMNVTLAKTNNTNVLKTLHEKHVSSKPNVERERTKRALNDEDERPFWPNRGKKNIDNNLLKFPNENGINSNIVTELHNFNDYDQPFWATRGRRDGSSAEDYTDYIESINEKPKSICKDCLPPLLPIGRNLKNDMESYSPFWGNRGRRDSSKEIDGHAHDPFWGARGRRQDKDTVLRSSGFQKEDAPFWGNRGRRDDEPFWGNRGRRDDEPFWGNRGRRQDSEPFWGSRGRRQDSNPFWGNRGRRDDEPFWGNRGRRKDLDNFWPSRGRQKVLLKESILKELNDVENNIENLSKLKRNDRLVGLNSVWENRGRDSKIKYLYNGSLGNSRPFVINLADTRFKTSEPGTVHDNSIYAEQPYYILTERNSRSSSEDDPYVISRGKKYYVDHNMFKEARDRRGAIEEIVKSVRNDPYYIARGKKNTDNTKFENINDTLLKTKELVCAAIDLIITKKQGREMSKREIIDNDRDRRTILKKLAAQLQIDPYYVSRGKKNEESVLNEDLTNFINDLAEKCN